MLALAAASMTRQYLYWVLQSLVNYPVALLVACLSMIGITCKWPILQSMTSADQWTCCDYIFLYIFVVYFNSFFFFSFFLFILLFHIYRFALQACSHQASHPCFALHTSCITSWLVHSTGHVPFTAFVMPIILAGRQHVCISFLCVLYTVPSTRCKPICCLCSCAGIYAEDAKKDRANTITYQKQA